MKIIIFLLVPIIIVTNNHFTLIHGRTIKSSNHQYECKTDSLFSNLINDNIDTVFLFLNLNINIGESGLLIWKKKGTTEGFKFNTDSKGCLIIEPKNLDSFNKNINDVINNYFAVDKIDELERNPYETMHDYPIIISSYNRGSFGSHKFWRSDVSEKGKSILHRVSTICLNILYGKN